MADVFDVAKYILEKQGRMSTMKLQKLCYYSQAWALVWNDGVPLFQEDFQAWTNGPVCKQLFDRHKGKFSITLSDIDSIGELTECEKDIIDSVLKSYGNKTPQWLSDLTHLESPWNDARIGYSDGENCESIITKENMRRYYASL